MVIVHTYHNTTYLTYLLQETLPGAYLKTGSGTTYASRRMAECSATGTAIDRAARAVMGAEQASTSKHLASLVGHASVSNQPGMVQPGVAPSHLVMPAAGGAVESNQPLRHNEHPQSRILIPHHNTQHQAQAHPALAQHPSSVPAILRHGAHPNNHQALMHQRQVELQQQHLHSMHMHSMMLHQQQQQLMAARAQQRQRQHSDRTSWQTKSAPEIAVEQENVGTQGLVEENVETWHENLEESFLRSVQEAEEDDVATLGHEGIVEGASLEELAAAWAQAESEYDQLQQTEDHEEEDLANLWSGAAIPEERVLPYEFQNVNVDEVEQGDIDWMEEGLKYFHEGQLKQAIYSFEMELQKTNPNNARAWRMLGRCHAENDMDSDAIKCLEAAVDRDPFNPESLLALGVSYVNELNYEKALENLKAWFTHNPRYAGMELQLQEGALGSTSSQSDSASPFDEVKDLLLSALHFESSDVQADVHEALGVIYNVSKEYDAAADSFRKALISRPDDYQLWNKLGATLANGNRSDEALPNYQKAIAIKPRYARAWLNMAISHSNLQDHEEATRCYLQTLSLNPSANHCWVSSSYGTCILSMHAHNIMYIHTYVHIVHMVWCPSI